MSTDDTSGNEPPEQPPSIPTPDAPTSPPPMAPPPVMPTPMASPPAPDAGWGAPTAGVMMPPPKKSNSGMIVGIVVAVVIAVAAGGYFLTKSSGPTKTASLPESLAGTTQLHDATAQELTSQFESGEFGGMTFKAGLYGDGGTPGLIVMVTDEAPGSDLSSDFDDFMEGFTSTSQASVSGERVEEARGGIDFICSGLDLSGVPSTVCIWRDANIFGAVVDLRSADASAAIAIAEQVAIGVTG